MPEHSGDIYREEGQGNPVFAGLLALRPRPVDAFSDDDCWIMSIPIPKVLHLGRKIPTFVIGVPTDAVNSGPILPEISVLDDRLQFHLRMSCHTFGSLSRERSGSIVFLSPLDRGEYAKIAVM